MAILDRGRIIRCGGVEELTSDVRRFFVRPELLGVVQRAGEVLDVRPDGDQLAVTAAKAETVHDALARQGAAPNSTALSLDEVFEAYVVGRRDTPDLTPEPQLADAS